MTLSKHCGGCKVQSTDTVFYVSSALKTQIDSVEVISSSMCAITQKHETRFYSFVIRSSATAEIARVGKVAVILRIYVNINNAKTSPPFATLLSQTIWVVSCWQLQLFPEVVCECYSFRWKDIRQRPLCRSRSFKVTDFGTSQNSTLTYITLCLAPFPRYGVVLVESNYRFPWGEGGSL